MPASIDQPFRTEEVSFLNGKLRLSGSLRLPSVSGYFPSVVLIQGSGPDTRDGSGHLRDVAEYFATR